MTHSNDNSATEIARLRSQVAALKLELQQVRQEQQTSEEVFFARILHHGMTPFYIKDADHRWVFANDAFCHLLNLEPGALNGRYTQDVFPGQRHEACNECDEQFLQRDTPGWCRECLVSDTHQYIYTWRSRYIDPLTEQVYILGIVHDLSDQLSHDSYVMQTHNKQLEAMLQTCTQQLTRNNDSLQKEQRLRQYLENSLSSQQFVFMHGPVVLLDWKAAPGWPLDYVSPNISQFGFGSGHFERGGTYASLIHPVDRPLVEARWEQFGNSEETLLQQSYRIIGGDGSIHRVIDFKVAIRDARKQVVHYRGYLLNVTEQNRTIDALQFNEARFGSLANLLPHGIIELDIAGMVMNMNQTTEDMLGYSAQDWEEHSFWTIFKEQHARVYLAETLSHRYLPQGSFRGIVTHRNGAPLHVQFDWQALRHNGGRVMGYVAALTNINYWQQLVAGLQETQINLHGIIDEVPVLIWLADAQHRFTYINENWLSLTGANFEQALGLGWKKFIHADDLPNWEAAFDAAFAAQQAFSLHYRLRKSDGSYCQVLASARPYHTAEGEFRGYIGACQDVGTAR